MEIVRHRYGEKSYKEQIEYSTVYLQQSAWLGWQQHFFTADRDGNCETIEFVNGKIIIHAGLSWDITKDFVDYTFELNKKFVKMDIEGIIKNSPSFEQQLISNGITKDILIDRLERYSESTVCKK